LAASGPREQPETKASDRSLSKAVVSCGTTVLGQARALAVNQLLEILWWLQNALYCALWQGGSSAGLSLRGRFPAETLRAIAASMS
jgi:hypothetical protein